MLPDFAKCTIFSIAEFAVRYKHRAGLCQRCSSVGQGHDTFRCSAQEMRRHRSGGEKGGFAYLPPQAGRAVRSGTDEVPVKGFSLEERAATGKAFGAPASQGTKSWARMPTAVQPSGTGSASCSGTSQPVRRTACASSRVQGRMFLQPVSRAAVMLRGSAKTSRCGRSAAPGRCPVPPFPGKGGRLRPGCG